MSCELADGHDICRSEGAEQGITISKLVVMSLVLPHVLQGSSRVEVEVEATCRGATPLDFDIVMEPHPA